MNQIMALVSKSSVLLAFIFISTFIGEKLEVDTDKKSYKYQVIQGIIFSVFIIIDIKTPFIANGISYDAREILLNLSAAVYGPLVATITVAAAFAMRMITGTKGTGIAISGIALVYIAELVFLYFCRKSEEQIRSKSLFVLSIITNLISAVSVLMISGNEWKQSLIAAGTVIIIYPLFTVQAFRVMKYILNREKLLSELSKRDKILLQKNIELKHANQELEKNKLHFQTIFYNSSEAIFLMEGNRISDLNLAAMLLLEQENKEEAVGRSLLDYMPETQANEKDSKEHIRYILNTIADGKAMQTEIILRTESGRELFLEGVFIEMEMMDKKYTYLSARDIGERKRQQEEILYKAQHDALTHVANRQHFNEVVKKLSANEKNYPIGFIMADINGLKLTNDLFGHSKGDELIVKISQVLSKSCRNRDLVARIGGDEFGIIFPNSGENIVKTVIDRIKENLRAEKIGTMSLSLAMGYSIKNDPAEEVDEALQRADDMMYEQKITSRQANARIFLNDILMKLYEISPEDKIQSETLLTFCENCKLCDEMTFACKKEVEKLIRYLNIGKLTTHKDDWRVSGNDVGSIRFSYKLMESSYGILRGVGEMESISVVEYLLAINETWDGTGGMMGIQEEEIPLPVQAFRIIFDAYYIKNHPEIFGSLTQEQILERMEKEVGKKYSPKLFATIKSKILIS